MKFPILKPGLELSGEIDEEGGWEAIDFCTGQNYSLSDDAAALVPLLDGKSDAYVTGAGLGIEEETVEDILSEFSQAGLIRTHRIGLDKAVPGLTYWFGAVSPKKRRVAKCFSKVLLALSFPALAMCCLGNYLMDYHVVWMGGTEWGGLLFGFGFGIFFHEVCHHMVGSAQMRIPVEAGLCIWPPLAFVTFKDARKKPWEDAWFYAAGPIGNLVLAALFMLIAVAPIQFVDRIAWSCYEASQINFWMALGNLLIGDGLDGVHVFSALIGVEDFDEAAKSVIKMGDRDNIALWFVSLLFMVAKYLFVALMSLILLREVYLFA